MVNRNLLFVFISPTLLFSCNSEKDNSVETTGSETENTSRDPAQKTPPLSSIGGTTNQEFRTNILPKITNPDDVRELNQLLTKLDARGLSFCQFMQHLFALDDSCYAVAKKLYPNPADQNLFSARHDAAIKIAQPRYLKNLRLSDHDADFATVAYSFDMNIKNFCGNY